jgi:phenylalanyl-tRNA synthetase beta chain
VKLPADWLREFVDVPAAPRAVASKLTACGFDVASVDGGVIDVEVTANRPDCLSIEGLAREVAAAFSLPLKQKTRKASGAPASQPGQKPILPVSIGDAGCGRYALAVADVSVGESPDWLRSRLTEAGVRPISNLVDVTNYVMLEMGHPMHAFDLLKLTGPEIRVRRARAAEKLKTLDGQDRTLDETMLVIADRDRAVALAGVMGGAATEVSHTTTAVAIESAWFRPTLVRSASRRLGLKTEASARFERGADVTAPVRALERALALLTEIGAGQPRGAVVDVYPHPHVARHVALDRRHVARLLGTAIEDAEIERILRALEFRVATTPDGWTVDPPPFRVDVTREADLIEEIGRHWGFDRIPPSFPPLRTAPSAAPPAERETRRILCGAGLQEAETFTFIEQAAAAPFASSPESIVAIANPLSEKFAVLRPSLLPGLLDSLVYNRRRGTADVRLFEVGSTFSPDGERRRAGWVMTGARVDHWAAEAEAVDFFDAKGVAELLAAAARTSLSAEAADDLPWLVRGRAARLVQASPDGPVLVGSVGQIRPAIVVARGGGESDVVYAGQIDLGMLGRAERGGSFQIEPLPRQPSIVRDVSILVDERLPAARVRGTIRANAPATLVALREFDRYEGPGVPSGRVSLSIRMTFRDRDRTLTDGEVQQAVELIVRALEREHGAVLR